jgi:hypothetical protein
MKYLLLFFVLFSSVAYAGDEEEDSRKVVYKQKTEIDFEGLEVEGVLQKPQSALVIERRSASFNPLIKLRTDFNDKIEENTDEIK